jgi:serine/threonine protein kinase
VDQLYTISPSDRQVSISAKMAAVEDLVVTDPIIREPVARELVVEKPVVNDPVEASLQLKGESAAVGGESYELGERIGGGGASWVYECTNVRLSTNPRIPKTLFAIKLLKGNVSNENRRKLEDEVETMHRANHIHVARVRGIAEIRGWVGVIMQPRAIGFRGNTLHEYLQKSQFHAGPTPPSHSGTSYELQRLQVREELYGWMRCLIGTMYYLHSENIIHGDIKPQNILLDQSQSVKERIIITDFGISFYTDAPLEKDASGKPQPGVTTHFGTIDYLPPTAFADEEFTRANNWGHREKANDIYALGCVFWEMWSKAWKPVLTAVTADTRDPDETFAAFWNRVSVQKQQGKPFPMWPPSSLGLAAHYYAADREHDFDLDKWMFQNIKEIRDKSFEFGNPVNTDLQVEYPGELAMKFQVGSWKTVALSLFHINSMIRWPKYWDMRLLYRFRNHFWGVDAKALGEYLNKPWCPCDGGLKEDDDEYLKRFSDFLSYALRGFGLD